jgi:hypothetical protein
MESRSMLTGDELPMAGDGCLMFSFESFRTNLVYNQKVKLLIFIFNSMLFIEHRKFWNLTIFNS